MPSTVLSWIFWIPGSIMATYYAKNSTLVVWSLTGYARTKDGIVAALTPFIDSVAKGLNISVQLKYSYTS